MSPDYYIRMHQQLGGHREAQSIPTLRQMAVKVLLIGLEYGKALVGPRQDIEEAERVIKRIFQDADITIMADWLDPSSPLYPTCANMRLQFATFIEPERDNIRYILWYAGHSDQKDANDFKEDDKKDEYLIPVDAYTHGERPLIDMNLIIDDNELSSHLVESLRLSKAQKKIKNVSLLAIFDSCHSGTMLDLPHHRCNRVSSIPARARRVGRRVREAIHRQDTIPDLRMSVLAQLAIHSSNLVSYYNRGSLKKYFKANYRPCSGLCLRLGHQKTPFIVSISAARDKELAFCSRDFSMSRVITRYLEEHHNPTLKDLMRHLRKAGEDERADRDDRWDDWLEENPGKVRPEASIKAEPCRPEISSLYPLHMDRPLFLGSIS